MIQTGLPQEEAPWLRFWQPDCKGSASRFVGAARGAHGSRLPGVRHPDLRIESISAAAGLANLGLLGVAVSGLDSLFVAGALRTLRT
jgi:hypothetical protein